MFFCEYRERWDNVGTPKETPMQQPDPDPKNRREFRRTAFSGKAYLTYDGQCRCEEVVDVSAEGLFLRTAASLTIGKAVKVFLPLPVEDGFRLCLLKGEVVRRAEGVGIAFVQGEVDTRGLLQRYVEGAC